MATVTTASQDSLNRRRALAMALQQMSMQPLESPNVKGARISPWEGVSKVGQALLAGYQNKQLDKEQAGLTQSDDATRLAHAMWISQAAVPEAQGDTLPAAGGPLGPQAPGPQLSPAPQQISARQDKVSALAIALSSPDPSTQKAGQSVLDAMLAGSREEKQQAAMAARQAAENQAQYQQAQDAQAAQQRFARDQAEAQNKAAMEREQAGNLSREKIAAMRPEPQGPAPKSLQNDEYVLKDGSRAQLSFDPTPTERRPGGVYIDTKGRDVTENVVGKYHQPPASMQGDGRLDKSFQFNSTQLAALQKPIDETVARYGRLQSALAQGTPQADALIGPELLTVMAGGQGSGLRMTEAEIARIIGGRSKWEGLKASINKWSLDPKTANSITDEQRAQIRALTEEVGKKLGQKQAALANAGQKLIDGKSVEEHRQAIVDARKAVIEVDQAMPENGEAPEGTIITNAAGKKMVKRGGKWVNQ